MAPKKPDMVIIVSVVISRLCTGHLVSRSRIYSFPQNERESLQDGTREQKVYHFERRLALYSWWNGSGVFEVNG
jgi:hypothetical protein